MKEQILSLSVNVKHKHILVLNKNEFIPNPKNPVKQEATKEAEDNIGPRIPGIKQHEPAGVQVQVLVLTRGQIT